MAGLFRGLGRLGVALVVMGAATVGFAQEAKTTLALPPAPLLPAQLGSLTRVAEGDSGDGLGALDATDATVLKEDGIRRFARSEYTEDGQAIPEARPRVDGKQHGTVRVYQFMDASGAVAAFDYFRSTGKGQRTNTRLGDASTFDKDGVVFRSGVNVVREDFNRGGETLMTDVITHLPKVGGPAGITPWLPTLVPTKGLEAGSVKYALGPSSYTAMGGILPPEILGWDKSAEVVTAKYAGGGVLTMLLYPTPQIAGDRGRAIEASINANRSAFGAVRLRREGPLLVLATGGFSAAQEGELVEGIHLPVQLTWDKKMPLEFHSEIQKTYSLLESIAIFCGLGALAAVILGVFLGGARAAIRVMQGKPAATEPEFLRIDLRGQSAPLHMESRAEEPKG